MGWFQTILNDLSGLWDIKEIRLFVIVVLLGVLLYFLLINIRSIADRVRNKSSSSYRRTKQGLEDRAFMMKKKDKSAKKEKNFEIYREYVEWTEKPLWVWRVKQIIAERGLYVVIILVLLYFIIRALF